jgi:hypothetical protein
MSCSVLSSVPGGKTLSRLVMGADFAPAIASASVAAAQQAMAYGTARVTRQAPAF